MQSPAQEKMHNDPRVFILNLLPWIHYVSPHKIIATLKSIFIWIFFSHYQVLPCLNTSLAKAMDTGQDNFCFLIHAYTTLLHVRILWGYFIHSVDKKDVQS